MQGLVDLHVLAELGDGHSQEVCDLGVPGDGDVEAVIFNSLILFHCFPFLLQTNVYYSRYYC